MCRLAFQTLFVFTLISFASLGVSQERSQQESLDQMTIQPEKMDLPEPYATKSSVNVSQVIGWGTHKPVAPEGFEVTKFAGDLEGPRWTHQLPNGFILVSESVSDRITLLIDKNEDGTVDEKATFFQGGISRPFGIAYTKGTLFIAGESGVWKYPYKLGDKKITSKGTKILSLPTGGHWTRNLLLSQDGKHLYVAVGSSSNVAEDGINKEKRRANILKIDLNGKNEEVFASGLRNPVGLALSETGTLWTAVNERDGLGDRLVPDYITQVQEGAFYGWPYSYYGQHEDPRQKGERPDLVKKARMPDVALGSHTASLGLTFYPYDQFPGRYKWGAFVGQHGSWNRSHLAGYQVVFIPFEKGRPSRDPELFLTGFIANLSRAEVYGRPVGVEALRNGSLLVADDAGNTLWLVRSRK